jgi:selenoprotein W-related protein
MANALLDKYGTKISSLTLIPSEGGAYEVEHNDLRIFSKKETGRFPEFEEIVALIEK